MSPSLRFIAPLLLPVILGGLLSFVFIFPLPRPPEPPALTSSIPLENELEGWYGLKQQESDQERLILSQDTKFRKACYFDYSLGETARKIPCFLSVIISGRDMNSSIHRPEACLPTQGHFNLRTSTSDFILENGKKLKMAKLYSELNVSSDPSVPEIIHCIHYYVFIGRDKITHSHLTRTFHDIKNRIFKGQMESWAYIQLGVNYGSPYGTTEQDAERQLEKLITQLIPQLIQWDLIPE